MCSSDLERAEWVVAGVGPVELLVLWIDTEPGYDVVEIFACDDPACAGGGAPLGAFSGTAAPGSGPLVVPAGAARVAFRSDDSDSDRRGFEVAWAAPGPFRSFSFEPPAAGAYARNLRPRFDLAAPAVVLPRARPAARRVEGFLVNVTGPYAAPLADAAAGGAEEVLFDVTPLAYRSSAAAGSGGGGAGGWVEGDSGAFERGPAVVAECAPRCATAALEFAARAGWGTEAVFRVGLRGTGFARNFTIRLALEFDFVPSAAGDAAAAAAAAAGNGSACAVDASDPAAACGPGEPAWTLELDEGQARSAFVVVGVRVCACARARARMRVHGRANGCAL